MAKRKDVREILRPHLERLGARCLRLDTEPDSLGFAYESWELHTGAGRLEIHPGDSWAPKGKRKRHGGHIHSRFDDSWLGGAFMGETDQEFHNGKWNFYAHDATEESARVLVNCYVRELERAIAWRPSALDFDKVARWKARYDARWNKSA